MIAFCLCGQKSEQAVTIKDNDSANTITNVSISDTSKTNEKAEHRLTRLTMTEWKMNEDSLRNMILRKKKNKILKGSFLQEMYIRNIVDASRGSLFATIPFNLHGPDCGAPDCYSTDISFSFKLGNTVIFPKYIQFQEHEHGCVDKERKLSGRFQLIEETEKHVIYHSAKHKRTLILFSSNQNGTTAYYFTGVEWNKINDQNLYNIKDYKEGNKSLIYPFTSWVLTTNEYEHFLK